MNSIRPVIASPWFVYSRAGSNARRRLICFHHAGGAASMFRRWPDMLRDKAEIIAVQLPGREGRFAETPLSDAELLMARLVPEILKLTDAPYALYGHSLGALVAVETAFRLVAGGARPPDVVIVSGQRPAHLRPVATGTPRSALPDCELLSLIESYDGTCREVLENRELTQLLLPRFRGDFRLAETMPGPGTRRLSGPLLVLGGVDDKIVPAAELPRWREATSGPCEIALSTGGHFFVSQYAAWVCECVGQFLTRFD